MNPLADEEFVAFARDRARAASGPTDLQEQLRARYPRSIVRQRDLSGEFTSVWYVYRDGSWTSGDKPTEG